MPEQIENRMVVDSEWEYMEREEEIEPGCFTRFGTFVKEEYLMEVAAEDVLHNEFVRDYFLENVLDFIESNKEAAKQFLEWYYPEYGKGD